jgi:hypothetical protein
MKTKTKMIGAGVAAVCVAALGAYAMAQGGPGHGRMGMGHGMMGHGPMQGGMMGPGHGQRMGQSGDPAARLTAAKGEIGIKAEQTAAWDTYAKVVTEVAAERRQVREKIDRDAVQKMTVQERRAFRDSMIKQRDAAQDKVKAAAETLLAQLDEAQKAKAKNVLPGLAEAGHGGGMRQGMMGGQGGGHGMGGRGGMGGHGMGPRWN